MVQSPKTVYDVLSIQSTSADTAMTLAAYTAAGTRRQALESALQNIYDPECSAVPDYLIVSQKLYDSVRAHAFPEELQPSDSPLVVGDGHRETWWGLPIDVPSMAPYLHHAARQFGRGEESDTEYRARLNAYLDGDR